MKNSNWLALGTIILIMAVMAIGYGGLCNKSKDKNTVASSSVTVASPVIRMEGTLDGSTAQFASAGENGFWDKFCKLFNPIEAHADAAVTVNKILAITYGSEGLAITEATNNGNSFSLSLTKGLPYIIIFINGTTNVLGALKLDAATDLDALPLSNISSNIVLGDVVYGSGEFSGSISQANLLSALGIDSSIASAFGRVDEGMLRWCSLDNDNNGVLDFTENKQYGLQIDYGFNTNQDFDNITGTNYSVYTSTAFQGYMYYFGVGPLTDPGFTFDGDTCTATLHSPVDINGVNNLRHQYFRLDPDSYMFNYFTGESAVTPLTPPSGNYVITLTNSSQTITKTYTFENVKSQTIDANIYNIYVPSVKLTMSAGKATSLSYKWWRKTAGGWVEPTAEELNAVLNDASFEVYTGLIDPVRAQIASAWEGPAFAASGTIAVPVQSFIPTTLRVSYTDKAGFSYGFEWR